ncbi:hypothetical protein [Nannocystis sp. SCPEA4]|uniref:D-alanine--D-alanine ligase family protein n=1 Tax=Nannocystis sp. SCPEA4 TaxID=2996787 RepID=UPI00226DF468|nr:hypothetical protein [Nannocystis sp. SCPEA4]MCY1057559.1 hypothetical protein [Nannocystis sp. SCPEA4]
MRIGISFDLKPAHAPAASEPGDLYEELEAIDTIVAIEQVLRRRGHDVTRLGGGTALLDALVRQGAAERLDGVFNLAEGFGGRGRESQVPALLELLGLPFTGTDAPGLTLTLDKRVAKLLALDHGLPTPPFRLVAVGERCDDGGLQYPLFVKPVGEGSSIGIRRRSRCCSPDDLHVLVESLHRAYRQPVLVEEFLPGEEYTVGVIGNGADARVIGAMQIVPTGPLDEFVYALEYKRDYSAEIRYRMTDELLRHGALSLARLDQIHALALAAHRVFECRDISRVDLRCDRRGRVDFIEINPLPGLRPGFSDLANLAAGHGWTYDALVGGILDAAIERWNAAPPRRSVLPPAALLPGQSPLEASPASGIS